MRHGQGRSSGDVKTRGKAGGEAALTQEVCGEALELGEDGFNGEEEEDATVTATKSRTATSILSTSFQFLAPGDEH
jgi:hypothetical protein